MEGLVNIKDFMQHLQQNNLVIVHKNVLEAVVEEDLQMKRTRLLKQNAVTVREIIEARLLPLKTKQGIRDWIKSGRILQSEVITLQNGRTKILTSAIKRLGYV